MMERMKMNPLLMCDFYKTTHMKQYPEGLTKLVSYFTPRMTRIKGVPNSNKLVMFGLQYFCKDYLKDTFNKYFFRLSKEEMLKDYDYCLGNSISRNAYDISNIEKLYDLGYLPIEIKALPEGILVPVQVPCIEISNTHPDFAWLTNSIESVLSCEMWHPMISAWVGKLYRGIVEDWYKRTVSDSVPRYTALEDFSMRGQESYESAILSSAGWCLSFLNTATVPVGKFFQTYYNANIGTEDVIKGAIGTEHSVMTSNFAVDKAKLLKDAVMVLSDGSTSRYLKEGDLYYFEGDETEEINKVLGFSDKYADKADGVSRINDCVLYFKKVHPEYEFIKRMLTEIYPNDSFSMVSDSYDFWNLVQEVLPTLRNEIEAHNGCLLIRGSSGDPLDIICGKQYKEFSSLSTACVLGTGILSNKEIVYIKDEDEFYEYAGKYFIKALKPVEYKGLVEALWDIFGGTVNEKGYKVLNPKIKALYGDSITPQRCEEIYRRLESKGFASNNVSLGAGSFSMQCLETKSGSLAPYTRDTFGIAVKATYGVVNGKEVKIFKDLKTDEDNFKKSQKGLCSVIKTDNGLTCIDNLLEDEYVKLGTELVTVFRDGEIVTEYTLKDIRERLTGFAF